MAQAEVWSLARELRHKKLEMVAIWGFSTICVAMGQWNVAIRYCERMRAIAEELGNLCTNLRHGTTLLIARYNYMIQFWDYACFPNSRHPSRMVEEARFHAGLNINLGRLYLMVGDVATAKFHAGEAVHWSAIFASPSTMQLAEALQGLVSIRLGDVESRLAAVNQSLTFAKRANRAEVPNYLATCMEAYETAGHLDKALGYLHERVDWKKSLIDAEVMALQFSGLTETAKLETGGLLFDEALVAKAHSLEAGVKGCIERLVEIALNAEIASGYDLYRPFRVAKLARYLATALEWGEQRIAPLALAAQVCNIGMIAIPARILLKPGNLSEDERKVLFDHAPYGAELLRKSQLHAFDVASVVAEQHHERYDGSGYPSGLKGAEIAEEARIVALCDVFDAMTHSRPWRAPLALPVALSELESTAGTQFDSLLVRTFVDLIRTEFWRPNNLDAFLAEGADELEYVSARARMEALIETDRGTHTESRRPHENRHLQR